MAKLDTSKKKYSMVKAHKAQKFQLYKIVAEQDFDVVLSDTETITIFKGQEGGYISSESILPQNDTSWIFQESSVYGKNSSISNSVIRGKSEIFGPIRIVNSIINNTYIHNNKDICGGEIVNSQISYSILKLEKGSLIKKSRLRKPYLHGKIRIMSSEISSFEKNCLKLFGEIDVIASEISQVGEWDTELHVTAPEKKKINIVNAHVYHPNEICVCSFHSYDAPTICSYRLKKNAKRSQSWAISICKNDGTLYRRKLKFSATYDILNVYTDCIDKQYLKYLSPRAPFVFFFDTLLNAMVEDLGEGYRQTIIQDKFFQTEFIWMLLMMLMMEDNNIVEMFKFNLKKEKLVSYNNIVIYSRILLSFFCSHNCFKESRAIQIDKHIRKTKHGLMVNTLSGTIKKF